MSTPGPAPATAAAVRRTSLLAAHALLGVTAAVAGAGPGVLIPGGPS